MPTNVTETQALVQVSGRGTRVNFKIDDGVPVETACHALLEHLSRNKNLYSSGEVVVDIGRRVLREDHRAEIRRVIESKSGLTVKQFRCEPDILERERQRITDLLEAQNIARRPVSDGEAPGGNGEDAAEAQSVGDDRQTVNEILVGGIVPGGERYGVPGLIVRGTCRAGEVIDVAGNLVILGNVNPGAQVTAGGDILVFGELRGQAHAGASGDATATIVAMSTAQPSLRIAGYAWRDDGSPPDYGHRGPDRNVAVIARVRNGSVHLTPYRKNYALDHGGNPHER